MREDLDGAGLASAGSPAHLSSWLVWKNHLVDSRHTWASTAARNGGVIVAEPERTESRVGYC